MAQETKRNVRFDFFSKISSLECGLIKNRICAILLTGEAWVTFAPNQSHNMERMSFVGGFDSWIVLDIT